MNSCSDKEKTEFANDFYNKDGRGSSSEVYKVMKPYVSEEVYDKYLFRLERKNHIPRSKL